MNHLNHHLIFALLIFMPLSSVNGMDAAEEARRGIAALAIAPAAARPVEVARQENNARKDEAIEALRDQFEGGSIFDGDRCLQPLRTLHQHELIACCTPADFEFIREVALRLINEAYFMVNESERPTPQRVKELSGMPYLPNFRINLEDDLGESSIHDRPRDPLDKRIRATRQLGAARAGVPLALDIILNNPRRFYAIRDTFAVLRALVIDLDNAANSKQRALTGADYEQALRDGDNIRELLWASDRDADGEIFELGFDPARDFLAAEGTPDWTAYYDPMEIILIFLNHLATLADACKQGQSELDSEWMERQLLEVLTGLLPHMTRAARLGDVSNIFYLRLRHALPIIRLIARYDKLPDQLRANNRVPEWLEAAYRAVQKNRVMLDCGEHGLQCVHPTKDWVKVAESGEQMREWARKVEALLRSFK